MSCTLEVDEVLKTAEGIALQLKNCKNLPQAIQEILSLGSESDVVGSGGDHRPSDTRYSTPSTPEKTSTSIQLKAVSDNSNGPAMANGGSESGTAVTTPDDSSIEILPVDHMDMVL